MSIHVKDPFDENKELLEEDDENEMPSFLDLESDEASEDILFSLSPSDTIKNTHSSSFSLQARRAIEDYWTRKQLLDPDLDLLSDDKKK